MREIDRDTVIGELASLYAVDLDDAALRVWQELIEQYSDQEIHRAAREWMRSQKWMPKPSELLSLIRQARDAACGAATYDYDADQRERSQGMFRRPAGVSVLDCVAALRRDGKSLDEIAEAICGPEDRDGCRYGCLLCEDSGYVQVWRPEAMRAAARQQAVPWLVCLAACSCHRGEVRTGSGKHALPRYDADRMLRVRGSGEEAIEDLRKFMANYWKRRQDPLLAQFSSGIL